MRTSMRSGAARALCDPAPVAFTQQGRRGILSSQRYDLIRRLVCRYTAARGFSSLGSPPPGSVASDSAGASEWISRRRTLATRRPVELRGSPRSLSAIATAGRLAIRELRRAGGGAVLCSENVEDPDCAARGLYNFGGLSSLSW